MVLPNLLKQTLKLTHVLTLVTKNALVLSD